MNKLIFFDSCYDSHLGFEVFSYHTKDQATVRLVAVMATMRTMQKEKKTDAKCQWVTT